MKYHALTLMLFVLVVGLAKSPVFAGEPLTVLKGDWEIQTIAGHPIPKNSLINFSSDSIMKYVTVTDGKRVVTASLPYSATLLGDFTFYTAGDDPKPQSGTWQFKDNTLYLTNDVAGTTITLRRPA